MKKLLLSIFILLISPLFVNAEVDYDIIDYYIEAYILGNGELQVKELFVLDGTFNGYERDIIYTNSSLKTSEDINFANNHIYNASGISNVAIGAKYVEKVDFNTMGHNDFEYFTNVNYAENGDKGRVIASRLDGGYRFRMYYPSNNNRVAFLITYTIADAVVIHNDVAELYWNFIGSDYADDIENLNIRVYLPSYDNTNNFRVWAHGDLSGEVVFLKVNNDKVGVLATMAKVDAYDPVDIRMTFDRNLITIKDDLDHSGVKALEKIIEVEEERAEIANKLRSELKFKYYAIVVATISYYIAILISFIIVVKKYGLDKKSDFDYEYNREFIDDYNVEVVDYLINKKKISPNAMSASIMNLIYKKNIKVEEIITPSNKKDYQFTLLNQDNLNISEKLLVAFLFNTVGKTVSEDNKIFTAEGLKRYASSSKYCDTFINKYTAWKDNVTVDGEKEQFYENTAKSKIIGIIFLVVAGLLVFISNSFGADFTPTYITPVLALIFLIYTLLNTKKSSKGALHYKKWMAFKRFLEDFGTFKEKELPEIALWERYLVYATVFGIADKVEKAMNVKIKELELANNTTYTNVYVYHNLHISNTISRAINSSVQSSYQKQAANRAAAASSSSSGGGFGGGFSSGGGFGGGGGGGRGF